MNETIEFFQTIALLTILYILFRNSRGNAESVRANGRKMVLDTSALIDGRIVEIAHAGFAPTQLIVPKFIVAELQLLADGGDAQKRERARFGLDMVKELQESKNSRVSIARHDIVQQMATDDKLVALAKKIGADLCTTDYNLNKVATIEGVKVLNVNELANALRPVALPGERKRIKIVQKGSNRDQGVGYMDDGSMVVVEGAKKSVGQTLEVEISRFIQTDAGKMLFATRVQAPSQDRRQPRKN